MFLHIVTKDFVYYNHIKLYVWYIYEGVLSHTDPLHLVKYRYIYFSMAPKKCVFIQNMMVEVFNQYLSIYIDIIF